MVIDTEILKFENKIDVKFKNKELLKQVFVHRSYINENPKFGLNHNERLEFLGDAVLELIVTEYLYKNYPNPEGELTNWRSALVKGQMLSKIADNLEINDYLYLSRGEEKSTGKSRQIILANSFEALIGAIYLDQGYDIASAFIHKFLIIHLNEILEKELYRDSKSRLQELSQEKNGITPEYRVLSESGPDHDKSFEIGVFLGNDQAGIGTGSSKQEAEQHAAQDALKGL
jgi:ribonuclease-3